MATPNTPSSYYPSGTTQTQIDSRDVMTQYLKNVGLDSLTSWAWGLITQGASTAQIQTDLYNQPTFQQRFPAIFARQKSGLPALSVTDYLNYEQSASAMEQAAGLPQGIIDVNKELTNNVSFNELQNRVQDGYSKVANAPQEIKDKFSEWYGPAGNQALAAYFLDPEKALPMLDQQLATAQVGGTANRYGIDISQEQAMHLGQIHNPQTSVYQMGQLEQGFQQVQNQRPLFSENLGENQDLTEGGAGVNAAFGMDANSQIAIAQRLQQRIAQQKGQGGVAATDRGLIGAGGAQHT